MPPNISSRTASSSHEDEGVSFDSALNKLIEATPFFDIEVPHSDLFEGAYNIVSKVFVSWKRKDISFVQCKDGITNQLVKVTYQPTKFSVLVRAYGKGSERIIDRKQEIVNIITLSSQNMCPPLYARFRNGLMYGFIKGRVSTVQDFESDHTARMIAQSLARWHKVRLLQEQESETKDHIFWSSMTSWLSEVPCAYDDKKKQERFQSEFSLDALRLEFKSMRRQLEALHSPVVFCHNDLLCGNIIFNDEKGKASFIDYEYGCYGFRGFDIGNHFNEFAGMDCDYSRYPDKDFQLKWFTWYLTEYIGAEPTDEELEKLYTEVEGFSLASHFYWGLWGLIQAKISDIDFDYMEYAVMRFNEYNTRKVRVFSKE